MQAALTAAEQEAEQERTRSRVVELEEANRTLLAKLTKAEATVAKVGALKQQYILLKSKLAADESGKEQDAVPKASKARPSMPASTAARGVLQASTSENAQ